jgi:hypothetical protein
MGVEILLQYDDVPGLPILASSYVHLQNNSKAKPVLAITQICNKLQDVLRLYEGRQEFAIEITNKGTIS